MTAQMLLFDYITSILLHHVLFTKVLYLMLKEELNKNASECLFNENKFYIRRNCVPISFE